MSYNITLYSIQTRRTCGEEPDELLEDETNITPFTKDEYQKLCKRLESYGYVVTSNTEKSVSYSNAAEQADALLKKEGLYFSANSENGMSEILQTGSEFTDDGRFARWDPQQGDWQSEPL